MKFLKFFAIAALVLVVSSCGDKGGFSKSKYETEIQQMNSWDFENLDYSKVISMYDELITYFEGKYTPEQLKEVGNRILQADQILGEEDYELFKLMNQCENSCYGMDLGANQEAYDKSKDRRSALGM